MADEEDDPGVYLTTTAPPPASGMDVWRVDTAGIPVEPDASHAWATRQEGYEGQAAGTWMVAYAPIPPERLTLLHDGRSAR